MSTGRNKYKTMAIKETFGLVFWYRNVPRGLCFWKWYDDYDDDDDDDDDDTSFKNVWNVPLYKEGSLADVKEAY
jgi:hypothetical protein